MFIESGESEKVSADGITTRQRSDGQFVAKWQFTKFGDRNYGHFALEGQGNTEDEAQEALGKAAKFLIWNLGRVAPCELPQTTDSVLPHQDCGSLTEYELPD
jgi:hypothetical protein